MADDTPRSLESLGASELAAVATIWKRERRTLTARFGGVSMLPTIAPGTPLDIVCGDAAQPGDVILFIHRGQVVVHRLLAFRRRWMLTRGDANVVPDLPVRPVALVGRVISANRYAETRAQRVSRTIVATMLSLGAPFARLTVAILWRMLRVSDVWRRVGLSGIFTRLWSRVRRRRS